jgi:DNA-binding transcriptional ArsR family regulator
MRVEDPERAAVLLHPIRERILARLRTPASASEVARELGMPAPRVSHHFRRLRETGLIRRSGSRRVRNLTEILYTAIARTYIVAEGLTPGGEERRQLRNDTARRPLRNLIALGERLNGDALLLLDEAARDGREFSTYATAVDLAFPDASARAAFLADLLAAVKSLRERYGGTERTGAEARYTTIIACYPDRAR